MFEGDRLSTGDLLSLAAGLSVARRAGLGERLSAVALAKVAVVAGRAEPKRPCVFDRHAGRWKFGMRAAAMGQLVQMDHMSVSFPGATVKNFTAVCPTTGYLVARAYSRATSHNAAHFFEHVLDAMPFAVRSIQVDGGSEFRGAFEQACQ